MYCSADDTLDLKWGGFDKAIIGDPNKIQETGHLERSTRQRLFLCYMDPFEFKYFVIEVKYNEI